MTDKETQEDIKPEWINLVCAADDNFSMQVAVTVRSVIDNLDAASRLMLFVIDGGISKQNKRKIIDSWDRQKVSVSWVKADESRLQGCRCSGHWSLATYYRLLMAELVPAKINKVIYIDCDMIVRTDLTKLWQEPLDGKHVLAVRDQWSPYMDCSQAFPEFDKYGGNLGIPALSNWKELGFNADTPYFNAGLLVIDLKWWRENDIGTKIIEYIQDNLEHVDSDQDGLNAVLAGEWKEINPRWNRAPMIDYCPSHQWTALSEEIFNEVKNDPWLIHFATHRKPWNYEHNFVYGVDDFFKYLKKTEWKDWTPKAPYKLWERAFLKLKGLINSV